MENVITASMVCFPYVIVGIGQAIILGTHSAGRTVRDTTEATGRKIFLTVFDEKARKTRQEDTGCKVCFVPGCRVFTPR